MSHPEELLGDRVEPVLKLLLSVLILTVTDSFSLFMHQAKEKSRNGGQREN